MRKWLNPGVYILQDYMSYQAVYSAAEMRKPVYQYADNKIAVIYSSEDKASHTKIDVVRSSLYNKKRHLRVQYAPTYITRKTMSMCLSM